MNATKRTAHQPAIAVGDVVRLTSTTVPATRGTVVRVHQGAYLVEWGSPANGAPARIWTSQVEPLPTRATRAAQAMAERVRRSTGREATVENTGGGQMVAVVTAPNGTVIAFHPEGYAVYADVAAWEGGDVEPVHQDSTTPLNTVLAVTALLVGAPALRCEFCGAAAIDEVRDVNASGPWVAVCREHEDRVTEHAPDCDCDDCDEERTEAVKAAALAVDPSGDLLVCDNTAPTDGPSYSLEGIAEGVLGYVGINADGAWGAETDEGDIDGLPDAESAVRWVVEHQAPRFTVYTLTDGLQGDLTEHDGETSAMETYTALVARQTPGDVEVSVVAATPNGDILAETTIPAIH